MTEEKINEWKEEPYSLLLTDLDKLNDKGSFTVARVIDGVNCVELHYVEGKATIEYGERVSDDAWESTIEDIDWFNLNTTEDEIFDKLWELFDEYYKEGYEEVR